MNERNANEKFTRDDIDSSVFRDEFGFRVTEQDRNLVRSPSQISLVGRLRSVVIYATKDKWSNYKNLDVLQLPRDSTLEGLVRYVGVPSDLRSRLWPRFTQAALMRQNNLVTYRNILETQLSEKNAITNQIELDLHRTLPNNKLFEKDEGLNKLRNILVAFSWINTEVGYCQSMNFWAAFLLLFTDEESAFWLTKAIVETLLPKDYYTNDMLGVVVDGHVAASLLQIYLPKVHHHLINNLNIDLPTIISQWFLCLFVTYLPPEAAARFMDIFLYEGNKLLFRSALAIFRLCEQQILALDSFEEAFPYISKLPTQMHDVNAWVDSCYDKLWLFRFNRDRINSLRDSFREKISTDRAKAARHYQRKANRKARINPDDAITPEHIIQSVLAEFEDGDLGGAGSDGRPVSPGSASRRRQGGYRPRSWRTMKLVDNFNIIEDYHRQKAK